MNQMSNTYLGRKTIARMIALFAAVICLWFAGTGNALADATLTLTGGGPATYGNMYVGPYQVSVNGGASSAMICDDYATDISNGYSWSANAYTFSQLSSLKFFGNTSFGNNVTTADQAYRGGLLSFQPDDAAAPNVR